MKIRRIQVEKTTMCEEPKIKKIRVKRKKEIWHLRQDFSKIKKNFFQLKFTYSIILVADAT